MQWGRRQHLPVATATPPLGVLEIEATGEAIDPKKWKGATLTDRATPLLNASPTLLQELLGTEATTEATDPSKWKRAILTDQAATAVTAIATVTVIVTETLDGMGTETPIATMIEKGALRDKEIATLIDPEIGIKTVIGDQDVVEVVSSGRTSAATTVAATMIAAMTTAVAMTDPTVDEAAHPAAATTATDLATPAPATRTRNPLPPQQPPRPPPVERR